MRLVFFSSSFASHFLFHSFCYPYSMPEGNEMKWIRLWGRWGVRSHTPFTHKSSRHVCLSRHWKLNTIAAKSKIAFSCHSLLLLTTFVMSFGAWSSAACLIPHPMHGKRTKKKLSFYLSGNVNYIIWNPIKLWLNRMKTFIVVVAIPFNRFCFIVRWTLVMWTTSSSQFRFSYFSLFLHIAFSHSQWR